MPEDRRETAGSTANHLKWRQKARAFLAAILLLSTLPVPAAACIPGGAIRCAPPGALAPEARLGPMTREDINALVNLPGPAVTEAVRRDTARTWEAVRRQSLPPAIAYPPDPSHMELKGGMP
jgi:hypothetical protein